MAACLGHRAVIAGQGGIGQKLLDLGGVVAQLLQQVLGAIEVGGLFIHGGQLSAQALIQRAGRKQGEHYQGNAPQGEGSKGVEGKPAIQHTTSSSG
ncbi:hypothetical protein [Aeromonas jandaei]|uniref:hypothetical protein n=1 Tax=Aeromonas jandaei TaxID=650 RepID=UPI003EC87D38